MLCLNGKDIQRAVSLTEMMDRVEDTLCFYETGDFLMPMRYHLDYKSDTLLLMPCFTGDMFGTKLVSLFPGNTAKNKPMIHAVMVLNDAKTGEVLAVLDGRVLTAMRTGAVGGTGVRHLSPQKPHRLGLIGAGVQGFQQAMFACAARDMTRVAVYDIDDDKVDELLMKLSEALPGKTLVPASSVEELLELSDTVISATTASEPVLPDSGDLLKGKHYVGIGSYKPGMREFPEALYRLVDHVYVDTLHALDESGDLITPLHEGWIARDQVKTLGSLIKDKEAGADPPQGTTLFKSVGMALFDVNVSGLILEKARTLGLGQEVEF